ncbi:MAG: hypothetical protein H0T89_10530 [Deltaproteobacteria bacterium]|nr:hypothetical protein [Deltaproteobacteria bacterium]MDQ3296241.1 hypothetical protein [Myxococcota bacterium]
MSDLQKLHTKLCRELAQSEYAANVHTWREAKRLGTTPPAEALRAISEHARDQRPRFEALMSRGNQTADVKVGHSVGEIFSTVRHVLFDRLIDSERSYRGTLLGLHRGVDIVRLLREVSCREGDSYLMRFCDEWLLERLCLLEQAEQALAFFAEEPSRALASGFGGTLQASR